MQEGEESGLRMAGEGVVVSLVDRGKDRVVFILDVVNFLDVGGEEVGKAELFGDWSACEVVDDSEEKVDVMSPTSTRLR